MVNHMRHNRGQTGSRRSHHALKEQNIAFCESCGAPKMNHRMCLNCGKYKSRVVVDVQSALLKKEKKLKERNKTLAGASEKTTEAAK